MSIAKSLSAEQVAQIQSWVDEGADLSEVQDKLRSEMDVHVTYMEMRFLMDDLGIQQKSDPEPEPEEPEEEAAEPREVVDAIFDEEEEGAEAAPPSEEQSTQQGEPEPELDVEKPAAAEVSVTVSKVQQPGMAISGKVTFGGGNSADWWIDQMGQLGMKPDKEGFRPTEAEVMAFQKELQRVVQESGY